jgi:hypothetical protein
MQRNAVRRELRRSAGRAALPEHASAGDLGRLRTPKATPTLSRDHIVVRPHDIDTFPVRLLPDPAALGNVVVTVTSVL